MRRITQALAIVAALSGAARAQVLSKFLFDAAPGVSIPLGDASYRAQFSASFKMSLRLGGEFWFGRQRKVGIAAEVASDFEPLTWNGADDSHFGRIRALVGFRFLIGFRVGAIFLRAATGLDYIVGTRPPNPNTYITSLAYTVEPGFGIQFRITRRGVVGFAVGFPIAFPNLDPRAPGFTSIDCDLLTFIGARI